MYAKDNSYYVLNPASGTVEEQLIEQTILLQSQKDMLEEQLRLLNARTEEAFDTKIDEKDIT